MPCMHSNAYDTNQRNFEQSLRKSTEQSLEKLAAAVCEFYRNMGNKDIKDDDTVDISISYDGSWLTRGHSSLVGVGAVIELFTGLVLDFHVVSKYCQACTMMVSQLGKDSDEFTHWK